MTFITSLLLLNYRGDLMSYILIHPMIATPFYISTDNRPSAFRYQCPSATPTWGGGNIPTGNPLLGRGGHYLWKLLKIVCGIQSVSQLGQSRNVGIGSLITPSFRLTQLPPI